MIYGEDPFRRRPRKSMAGAKRRERCVRMTENKGKWASRHRKIEKLGCQAAAKIISFPRRWHGGMISANQEAIWGMSVKNKNMVTTINE